MAFNSSCSLCAVVEDNQLPSVHIYAVDDKGKRRTHVRTVVYGGFDVGDVRELRHPRGLCFVTRGGTETLLVADSWHKRVVELTVTGVFMRSIAVPHVSRRAICIGIDYTLHRDTIAVTVANKEGPADGVLLLRYDTGDVICRIDCKKPNCVKFAANGSHVFVADRSGSIRKFSASGGTQDADWTVSEDGWSTCHVPGVIRSMLCDDGGQVVVAHSHYVRRTRGVIKAYKNQSSLTYMNAAGARVRVRKAHAATAALMWRGADVCCKTNDGNVTVFVDRWQTSLRCVWVTACVLGGGDGNDDRFILIDVVKRKET
jgi:hypothetical protein